MTVKHNMAARCRCGKFVGQAGVHTGSCTHDPPQTRPVAPSAQNIKAEPSNQNTLGRWDTMVDMVENSGAGSTNPQMLGNSEEPLWNDDDVAVLWELRYGTADDDPKRSAENLRVFVDETWKYNPDAVARIISAQRWDVKGYFLADPRISADAAVAVAGTLGHTEDDQLVRTYSAVNPLLPDEVKQSYIREGDVSTLNELVEADALSGRMMVEMLDAVRQGRWKQEDGNTVRSEIAAWMLESFTSSSHAPGWFLEYAAHCDLLDSCDSEEKLRVLISVAANPNTPGGVLSDMVNRDGCPEEILGAVADNCAASETLLTQLYNNGDAGLHVLAALARNPATPARILDTLVRQEMFAADAAKQEQIDEKIVLDLLDEPSPRMDVALSFLRRANMSEQAENEMLNIRTVVDDYATMSIFAQKPYISDSALARLAQHDDERVADTAARRIRVRERQGLEMDLLWACSQSNGWAADTVSESDSSPGFIVAKVAGNGNFLVRGRALNNPACPVETIWEVVETERDGWLRERAAKAFWERTRGEDLPPDGWR